MDGSVTGDAFAARRGRLFRGLTVNAGVESVDFVGMTLGAFSGHQLFRGGQFVHAAVTRGARSFAEGGVGAGGEGFGLIRHDMWRTGLLQPWRDAGIP